MVWRLLFYREIHLFSIMKPKMTLVNFHHISHPMRNVIFLHQRHILYNPFLSYNTFYKSPNSASAKIMTPWASMDDFPVTVFPVSRLIFSSFSRSKLLSS